MKKFFVFAMSLQFLIETLVGLVMVFSPATVAPEAAITEIYQFRNQGFIAISIGLATVMLWFRRQDAAVIGYATAFFAIYHTLVTLSGIWNATIGFEFAPMMLHVVLGLFFWFIWSKRSAIVF